MAVINGYAFYAKVQAPGFKFQKEGSKDPLDKEYAIDVLVDAKAHKAFYKKYPSQESKNTKPMDKADFEKRFGVDPSTLDVQTNGDGEYCVIKLKTNNAYKGSDGKPVKMEKPKVFFFNDKGKMVEDTETLVGNGSKVKVQFQEYENKKWKTTSAKLKAVAVEELVPYGGDDFSELGELEEGGLADTSDDEGFDDNFAEEEGHDDSSEDDDDEPFGFE